MKSFKSIIGISLFLSLAFLSLPATESPAARYYSFGTASTGGSWYIVGAGLANHVNQQLSDIKITAEITGGAIEDHYLIKRGKIDITFSKPDILSDDIRGKKFGGLAKGQIMQLMWSYHMNQYHYVVKKDSPIHSLKDVKGKRFAVGPHSSSTQVMTLRFLKSVYGYEPDRDFKAYFYTFNDGQRGLQDGNIDIAHNSAGAPVGSLIDLCSMLDVRFIPVSKEELAAFNKDWPGKVVKTVIPKGTYKGQTEDLVTIGEPTGLVISPKVPEEDAYKIIKAIFTNVDQRDKIHPLIAKYTMEATLEYGAEIAKLGVPFHPGVKKYLKEIGKWNPDLEVK